jgi:hypothetical protein
VLLGAAITPSGLPLTVNFAGLITGLGTKTVAKAYKDLNDADLTEGTRYKDGKFNPFWMFEPKLNVEFGASDELAVGLTIYDFFFADGYYTAKTDGDDATKKGYGLLFPITFNPYITYAINDDVTLGGDIYLQINTMGSDVFGFGFKPSAEFSLGSGAKFVVYDQITFYGKSKGAGSDKDNTWITEHSGASDIAKGLAETSENILQFDFVWTF